MGILDLFRKRSSHDGAACNPAQIVERLGELGYFKYAAAADVPEIRKDLLNSLRKWNHLGFVHFDCSPYCSKDYRHYHFDGEDLFEEGGFSNQFADMKPLFSKMDFRFEVSNHVEDWDNERGLNHTIEINGTGYVIFKDFNDAGWGEAAQRFADMINDQMELQGKEERLYLINAGNDGNAVFLTEEQFALVDPILKGIDRPLTVEDWCKAYHVDRVKIVYR